MRVLVTGAAGFIGSNLTDRLLSDGHQVAGFDNLSRSRWSFLAKARESPNFKFIRGDVLDQPALTAAMAGVDLCCHLAANADVRFGLDHPRRDLEQNTIATSNVLESMRACGVRRIVFSSTGSVYGEPGVFPTPEMAPFPTQTSLYGASKIACEALISAYTTGFGVTAHIFRFVSVLGERYNHGHVYDFYRQLRNNPEHLRVLGNGKQRKSYIHVSDCVEAMLLAVQQVRDGLSVFNLGTDEYCEVNDSVRWMCEYLRLSPRIEYSGGERGWPGDSPFIFLDCSRIRALGWRPRHTIRDGVIGTVRYLEENPEVLENC